MWTPTCLDPGKVSDAEYYCATDDAGGVHRNSGVNNHAYALLVDGGTYNGRRSPASVSPRPRTSSGGADRLPGADQRTSPTRRHRSLRRVTT